MTILRAQVVSGRIVLDEETSLPEGKTVNLMLLEDELDDAEGMSAEEHVQLQVVLEQRLHDVDRGDTVSLDDALRIMRAM